MDEAVKSRSLAGRSRHSSAQGGARKPVAAEGHGRLLTDEGRDANLCECGRPADEGYQPLCKRCYMLHCGHLT